MSIWKLSLQLQEPVTCAEKPLTGNQTPTLPYIPATTLRRRASAGAHLGGSPRRCPTLVWRPGAPLESRLAGAVCRQAVPVPRSFLSDKGDDGFRQNSRFGIYNSLDPDLPVQTEEHRYEWKPYRESLIGAGQPGNACRALDRAFGGWHAFVAFHVRQTSRLGQLYSREELRAGNELRGWVMDPV